MGMEKWDYISNFQKIFTYLVQQTECHTLPIPTHTHSYTLIRKKPGNEEETTEHGPSVSGGPGKVIFQFIWKALMKMKPGKRSRINSQGARLKLCY